jgi:hypothetical protein
MQLMATDPKFKATTKKMVDEDPEFGALRARAAQGACGTAGRCAAGVVAPTARIYNGEGDVAFAPSEDGKVFYTRNGITREAAAFKCDASPGPCAGAFAVDPTGGATVVLSDEPVQHAYRMQFAGVEGEYVVMNELQARDGANCAARLCEHNAGACPASVCRVSDERQCVPK